jgi:hypothetical protein
VRSHVLRLRPREMASLAEWYEGTGTGITYVLRRRVSPFPQLPACWIGLSTRLVEPSKSDFQAD